MFTRNMINLGNKLSNIAPRQYILNSLITCRVKTGKIDFKRNASIHTRHILIQKAKLEHVNNFGILLLVCYYINIIIMVLVIFTLFIS